MSVDSRTEHRLERETDVLLMLQRLDATLSEQSRTWRSLVETGTLSTELVVIPASGVFSRDASVPYRAVQVDNLGSHTMTLTSGEPGGSAPGAGIGSVQILAGASKTVALTGRTVSLYGTPGDAANLSVYEKVQAPSSSGVPASYSGTAAPNATTGTMTNAAVTVASAVALAANPVRKGATFWNDGAATVYLALGPAATTALYTVQLLTGAYYELPPPSIYTGAVSAITAVGTATLRVTELT